MQIEGDSDNLERSLERSQRQVAALERQVASLERQMQSYERQVRRTEEQQRRQADETENQTREMQGGMASLAAAGGLMASAAAAAGAAFVSFASVSVPAVRQVLEAQEDLAESWDTLTTQQKASALLVRGLTDDYKSLAESYQPQALASFNMVVGTARGLLPELTKVVDGTAFGVQNLVGRLAAFAEGREVSSFLGFAAETAPDALDTLGTAMTTAGSLGLTLVQDLAPLGMSLLELTTGTLGAVNALARLDPTLAQVAVTAVLLRGPITGVIAGVGNMTDRVRQASAAATGATRSARLLNTVTALGPNLYVAAGVALGFLALKTASAKTESEKLVASLKATYQATGNNVVGYQQLINTLTPRLNEALATTNRLQREAAESGNVIYDQTSENVKAAEQASEAQREMGKAIAEAQAAQNRVIAGADQLARAYSISRDSALRLATAAGVDLSKSIDKNGQLTVQAALKVRQYKDAVEQANNPTWQLSNAFAILGDRTSTLEQRTKALTSAYNAELGPAINLFNATMDLKQGYAELIAQLAKGKGRMDGAGEASRQMQVALTAQIDRVWKLFTATREQTGSTEKATEAARRQLPVLYALAGGNADLRALVDKLARATGNATGVTNVSRRAFLEMAKSMGIARGSAEDLWKELQKIKSRNVDLTVDATGRWQTRGSMGGRPMATGGPVPYVDGSEAGKDSVPALLMPNEHVWTVKEVQAAGGHAAMYRLRQAALRGELKGYATGGPVAMTRAGADMGVVVDPIYDGISGLIAAIGEEFGRQWKEFIGSGGGVVAAARRWLGTPYSWGGGGIGGPSYGIGRGAGTWGFDCSGLTQYAWHAARKIDIGGVTYTQHPASVAIGGPKPGALGFNSSLGHVVLASDKPGYVIEAPYTGSHVREVRRSMPDWRWPRAALAAGGPVERAAGEDFLRGGRDRERIAYLGIAGDPGLIPSGRRSPQVRMATYDSGGVLAPGYTLAFNGTGEDEYVVRMAAGGGVPGAPPKQPPPKIRQLPYVTPPLTDAQKAIKELLNEIRKGVLNSVDSIREWMDKIREQIRKNFSGEQERRLLARTREIQKQMESAANRAQALADRIKEARDFAASTTSSARNFAGLSNLADNTSARGILTGLTGGASQIREFTDLIVTLRRRGLHPSLLRQIIELGPKDGMAMARTLAGVDFATWKDINAAQGAVDRAADALGRTGADALYDSGRKAGEGFLTGLLDQEKKLRDLMDRLGDRLADRLGRAYDLPKAKTPAQPPKVVPVTAAARVPVSAEVARYAAAQAPAARTVNILPGGTVVLRDEVDVDTFMNRAAFDAQMADFG